ncbi:MAG: exo-alpha-sialidase [Thaumarchaeota archaeon]|nr:exo-alpha-sialidase [Nitrososphaerota archaeon]MDE1867307.1 exo-alpha-sialidase [Nitrososphaerota archaeon]
MKKLLYVLLISVFAVSVSHAFADSNPTGFTNPASISSPNSNSTLPQLVASGNNVYVGWVYDAAGKYGVMLAKSNDGGASFGNNINLENINSGAMDNLRIAESQGKVYAVWQSFLANKSSVVFAKSDDDGATFNRAIGISDISKDSAFPQLAISNNHVYVTWIERTTGDVTNVIFAKSDDDGATFGMPTTITSHGGNSGIPKIFATENHVYLIWEDNSEKNFDVFLSSSNDSGTTFGTMTNVSNDKGDSGAPQMTINGNNVNVVWMDNTFGNFDILFSKSTDGGVTFTKPVNVSGNQQDSGYQQFVVVGDKIYVAWTSAISDKNYDILFAKSTDGGQTFGTPINISSNPGASGWPQISVDGNNVYTSWVDNTAGHYDIYISKSADDGNTFEAPIDVNSGTSGSWYNIMATSSNTVYLAWQQANPGSNDIMFVKSTTFVPEFGSIAPIILVISIISIIAISAKNKLRFTPRF